MLKLAVLTACCFAGFVVLYSFISFFLQPFFASVFAEYAPLVCMLVANALLCLGAYVFLGTDILSNRFVFSNSHPLFGKIVIFIKDHSQRFSWAILSGYVAVICALIGLYLFVLDPLAVHVFQDWQQGQSFVPLRVSPLIMVLVVVAVPLVEEVLFRGYVSSVLFQLSGSSALSAYCACVIFVLLHSYPTIESFQFFPQQTLHVGVLLLGGLCEWLRSLGCSLYLSIGCHMLANASLYIFSYFAPIWLEWLRFLYI
ncbi:MAG: CPBP family glutamic-type intramembrane protease [Proteobacteria bacterium]|nr:CPBP family glutamic-type intramembrane protease [Pseudomonadota bacterium]